MKPKIILIDDDPDVSQKLKGLFTDWKSEYELISNSELKPIDRSESAKQIFYEYLIELVQVNNDNNLLAVLLDVIFDLGDGYGENLGYEIGRELRIHFPELPIILFTVYDNHQKALNSFNFDGFILKGDLNNWKDDDPLNSTILKAGNRRKLVNEEYLALNRRASTIKAENPVIIHISDIHRGFDVSKDDPELYDSTLKSIIRDNTINRDSRISAPNMIVVSGDITTKGSIKGYDIAKKFLLDLGHALKIPKERIIICPGNHDLDRAISRLSYNLDPYDAASDNNFDSTLIPNDKYLFRFAPFKNFFDIFYEGSFVYNLNKTKMFTIFDFSKTHHLVIVSFNSCEVLDNFKTNQERSFISLDTVENALNELEAKGLSSSLKIAVWHHPVVGGINDLRHHHAILNKLSHGGFMLYMHGHSHNPFSLPPPDSFRGMYEFGAGTIGKTDTPDDVPRHYQVFAFDFNHKVYTVFSRQRHNEDWIPFNSFKENGAFKDTFSGILP